MSTDFEEESLDDLVSQVRSNTVSILLLKIFLDESLLLLKLSWISVLWTFHFQNYKIKAWSDLLYHSNLNLSLKSVSNITR